MNLPADKQKLDEFLRGQSRRLQAAVQQAESQREVTALRERESVICEHLPVIEEASQRLRALKDKKQAREAEQLVAELKRELARVGRRLQELGVKTSETPPFDESPQTESLAAKPAQPEPEPAADPVPDPQPSPEPVARSEPAPPSDEHDPKEGLTEALGKLIKDVVSLQRAAPQLDEIELECRVNIRAAQGRILQAEWPELLDETSDNGRALRQLFGALTRICTDHLIPRGYFVEALRKAFQTDWQSHLTHWQALLDTHIARREKDAAVLREEQDAARRRSQIENENARIRADLEMELADVLIEPEPDAYELRLVVAELLHFQPTKPGSLEREPVSDSLIDQLAPHAAVFRLGPEFKQLRKALRRHGHLPDESGRHEAVEAVGGDTKAAPKQAEDQFKGWFAGQRGAIVGGSCRGYRREQHQVYYGFAELEWVENERGERADTATLAKRIRNGSYDIILMLQRFCSHALYNAAKDACKVSGVPFALVARGYGRNQISAALTDLGDHLPPRASK